MFDEKCSSISKFQGRILNWPVASNLTNGKYYHLPKSLQIELALLQLFLK